MRPPTLPTRPRPLAAHFGSLAARPRLRRRPTPTTRPPAVTPLQRVLLDSSYLVGQGIVLFTFFYTALNWRMYRAARKQHDDAKDKDAKK
jgi:hypothetical protein